MIKVKDVYEYVLTVPRGVVFVSLDHDANFNDTNILFKTQLLHIARTLHTSEI